MQSYESVSFPICRMYMYMYVQLWNRKLREDLPSRQVFALKIQSFPKITDPSLLANQPAMR